MAYANIEALLKRYLGLSDKISLCSLDSYENAFAIDYTHNSTAIEGNTLTAIETKLIIEDGVSIGGKMLRELYEVKNHNNAFLYIKKQIKDKKLLDENIVKDIHEILMLGILQGGIYRNVDVYISGAKHIPPTPNVMYQQIKAFYLDLPRKAEELNPIELAAWTHAEFVKIHPFVDGNGRTSRLLMNYQLMHNGLSPISIQKETKLEYFNALEAYAADNNLIPFVEMIEKLEIKELKTRLSFINEPEAEPDYDDEELDR